MLSSPPTTRQPSHSPGPRKKSTGAGSKIAVSLNFDSELLTIRRTTAMLRQFVCAMLTILPTIAWAAPDGIPTLYVCHLPELPVSQQIRVLGKGTKPRLFSNA